MAVDTHRRVKSAVLKKIRQDKGGSHSSLYTADVDTSHEIATAIVQALIQRYYWRMEQDA